MLEREETLEARLVALRRELSRVVDERSALLEALCGPRFDPDTCLVDEEEPAAFLE
jgi:hypothetical protein